MMDTRVLRITASIRPLYLKIGLVWGDEAMDQKTKHAHGIRPFVWTRHKQDAQQFKDRAGADAFLAWWNGPHHGYFEAVPFFLGGYAA